MLQCRLGTLLQVGTSEHTVYYNSLHVLEGQKWHLPGTVHVSYFSFLFSEQEVSITDRPVSESYLAGNEIHSVFIPISHVALSVISS